MQKFHASILLAIYVFCVSVVCCMAFPEQPLTDASAANGLPVYDDDDAYYKRFERYVYGLGRRANADSNNTKGDKRVPIYNFGLGKRALPYSFGLGKRENVDDNGALYDDLLDSYRSNYNQELMDEKRNRPYSFGLGKRGKATTSRGYPNGYRPYGFGLGR